MRRTAVLTLDIATEGASGPGSFEQIARAHARLLRHVALRLCRGHEADAADLVQDTLARALARQDTLHEVSNVAAWLATILHHAFLDRVRSSSRRPRHYHLEAAQDLPAEPPAPDPVWSAITSDDVRRAADSLDEPFRAVFRMHTFERRSYEEIAATLGIPKATVGTRLVRARHKLRELLGISRRDPEAT